MDPDPDLKRLLIGLEQSHSVYVDVSVPAEDGIYLYVYSI